MEGGQVNRERAGRGKRGRESNREIERAREREK